MMETTKGERVAALRRRAGAPIEANTMVTLGFVRRLLRDVDTLEAKNERLQASLTQLLREADEKDGLSESTGMLVMAAIRETTIADARAALAP